MEIAFLQRNEWLRMNESHDSPPIGYVGDTTLLVSLSPLRLPSIEPPLSAPSSSSVRSSL